MTTDQRPDARSGSPRRSLILAGGGLKVAFQAGVLQVLLDEAELQFDHADGASGGVFNLAMYCQGMSGREIADNWRTLSPMNGVALNWREWFKGPYARSLFTLDGYRRRVFPGWGLDWERIRATDREATFNLYSFSANQLEVVTADGMDEDRLCAGVSLPMWFPPVVINGQTYIDPVYLTDGNVEEAIRRGCDELWIIWTVSRRQRWRDGFVANYFQIIETSANSQLQYWLRRIDDNNAAIRRGDHGEFERLIDVRLLSAEVPLNYLINFSKSRFAQAVELGVQGARRWCTAEGIPWKPGVPPDRPEDLTRIRFTERMVGTVAFGETDVQAVSSAPRGATAGMSLFLTIDIRGVDRFIVGPEHEASLQGEIVCQELGGRLPVERGTFQLFVEESDPEHLRMRYRLFFTDRAGHRLTLSGYKEVSEDSRRGIWKDTSVLYTRIVRGHVDADEESAAEVVASGSVHIRPTDFLKQLTTFRVEAPTLRGKATTLGRFGQFFFGKLWDVYGQNVLPWSPL
ncbi:patatin-like phospholipase family protein [Streptomyces sp. NPDC054838]